MIRNILSVLLGILLVSSVHAQPWMTELKKQTENPNFYQIQESFNKYWAKKDYEKGKGFKQFKRWEYFMEPRVNAEGYLPPDALWNAYKKYETSHTVSERDETANWTHLGPDDTPTEINAGYKRGSGRVNCVSFHPTDPDIFYVGAPSGGLWKTTDGGESYITTTDHLPSIGVSDIAIHPDNPDVIFIATGDGDARDTYSAGILKSTDAGLSWTETVLDLELTEFTIIRRLKIHPQNPDIILAASSNGIIRSINGGDSWEVRASGHFKDMEFKPGNPDVVYSSTYDAGGNTKIFKSIDEGSSWTEILNIPESNRIELAVTEADPGRIYALASDADSNGFLGVYRSNNSGDNWSLVYDNSSVNLLGWDSSGMDEGGQGWYDLALAASPDDADIVYAGGVNIWKTTDGGNSWNINSHWYGDQAAYVHADHHTLDYHPITHNLYSGNDGGLHRTSDGTNWTDISDGLQILQIYRFGNSATNNTRLVTGSQDNGTMRLNEGIWNAIIGGDGMECLIDYTDENTIYGEVYYGAILRSTNGGYDFTDIKPAAAGDGAWVTPFVIGPEDPNTLYAGYTELFKTTNNGNSWEMISSNTTDGDLIRNIAVAPGDNDVIYMASYYSIYRTSNGGANWDNISYSLPQNPITYIAVSPANPDHVWISMSGYEDGGKVYYSTNGGSNWSNYSDGLPNIPVNCIVYENNTNNALYVGTDLGVFYRNSAMSEWADFSHGLPNVIVNELEIQYDLGKLRAATYGRGVWESDLFEVIAAPTAHFSWNITNACAGEVDFMSTSSGVPSSYLWDFGDGNTSVEASPSHSFSELGTHDVKLKVENTFGEDSITQTLEISADNFYVDFCSDITNGCALTEVAFTNLSDDAETWLWDFGDGSTSDYDNPTHDYEELGSYDVSLTASTMLCGEITESKNEYINFDEAGNGYVIMPESGYGEIQVCCSGMLYDNGGPDEAYTNYTNSKIKLAVEFNTDETRNNVKNANTTI